MPASATPQSVNSGTSAPSSRQDDLINFCRARNLRSPDFQIISDRRGGRTAWSCIVHVHGTPVQARFWYDGQYVNNAREDAAEKALQMLGVLPPPPGPQQTHVRPQTQQQGSYFSALNGNS